MLPRALDNTKWLWCILAVYSGPWSPVGSVTVRAPPKTPATVEAQAKFFQDFFSVQLSPYKMEFGHVCEDPNTWEQRYEKKDFKNHRDMGKVRWGDKKGGYGEHYWDLNHAGHADKHGDDGDDGSYKHDSEGDDGSYTHNDDGYSVNDNEDPYDEPSEQHVTYDNQYEPEQAPKYDETNRAKRHQKLKPVKEGDLEEVKTLRRKVKHETRNTKKESDNKQDEEIQKPNKYRYKPKELNYEEEQNLNPSTQAPIQTTTQTAFVAKPESHFVPYEDGSGVRQHQTAAVAAPSAPRLFLDPSTGHIIDRATGQAYFLQPIVVNYQ